MSQTFRQARPRGSPKIEFVLTGMVIGVFSGELFALGVEFAMNRPSSWIMVMGGIAGLAVGCLFEAGRYCWRKRKCRPVSKSQVTIV